MPRMARQMLLYKGENPGHQRIGLTICRRIAQALGGSISVASEVGKGSTFTVTISTGPLDGIAILDAPIADGVRSARQRRVVP